MGGGASYRAVTPTGVPLRVVGRVVKKTKSRAIVEGELMLPDGTVSAQCRAMLSRPPKQVSELWESEREFWESQIPGK